MEYRFLEDGRLSFWCEKKIDYKFIDEFIQEMTYNLREQRKEVKGI